MTVHAAKGLEFKNVFVVGLEEDLFPSLMSKDSMRALEEERRLFYVAITRAEENCILTYAKSRFRNGKSMICLPSRFLKDIDPVFLDIPHLDTPKSSGIDGFSRERERFTREETTTPLFRREASVRQAEPKEYTNPQLGRKFSKIEADVPVTSSTIASIGGLTIGTRVSHERFGEGEITALEGEGGNAKATVRFDNSGVKQLLLKFAKLTVL